MADKHIVFVTNVASFYKIELIKRLSKYFKTTLVLIGRTDQVILDENNVDLGFNIIKLSDDDTDNKIKGILRSFKLINILKRLSYDYIVYTGWDNLEFNIGCCFTSKRKNCIICESSIFESRTNGIKGFIKRAIVNRFSIAFPSGEPHLRLLQALGFKGKTLVTGGVGIIEKLDNEKIYDGNKTIKYLFIGRLIKIKNIELLIRVFNKLNKPLTIVGTGPEEEYLKNIANSNVSFKGFINREMIKNIYRNYDCLILPSLKETWGLVVEEAIASGLPVLASKMVGSSEDLILKYKRGLTFDPLNSSSLEQAISDFESNFKFYFNNVKTFDSEKHKTLYLDCFKRAFE